MIRVAFVNQCGTKPGGAEESLALLLSSLPADIEPLIVLFERGEYEARLRRAGHAVTVVALPERITHIPRERPLLGALAFPEAVRTLTAALREHRVDLVHTNSVKAHLIAAPAARLRGIPCVMHLRDIVGGLGGIALRAVGTACSREQIAISHAVARSYRLAHTSVIANPVDLAAYAQLPASPAARRALGVPDDGLPLLGIVGRINRWKGQDLFLRAVAAAGERVPVRCAVVGEPRFRDDDFLPELHALARRLGIVERTHFVPWSDDPRAVFAALDVNCNCSVREPFGRTIVEAAAAGVPTVAFDDGGAVDIVRDRTDGRIVAAGDEPAFAAALTELAADPVLRRSYGDAARAGSGRFALASHATAVATVLRRSAA